MSARQAGWTLTAGVTRQRGPVAWIVRGVKIAVLATLLGAASIGAYCGIVVYDGNFHAVSPGILYRSAQPDKAILEAEAHRYGIKSVLNLRGANPGSPWYDEETAASRALGLVHYDYSLSARRFVTPRQIADILGIIRQAPKPLLVHCMSGADRAGLVSALYEYAIAGEGADEADRQLSLAYGHFPYLTSRTVAMDDSFWSYVYGGVQPAGK